MDEIDKRFSRLTAGKLASAGFNRPLKQLPGEQEFQWRNQSGDYKTLVLQLLNKLTDKFLSSTFVLAADTNAFQIKDSSVLQSVPLTEVRRRFTQNARPLAVHRLPCSLPETIIPVSLRAEKYGLLREAKLARVSATNAWDDVQKFAILYADLGTLATMGRSGGLAPYGFGMWITPQYDKLSVWAITEAAGDRFVAWMRDPTKQHITEHRHWIRGLPHGKSLYIPPGTVYRISSNFVLAGFVLKYTDITVWSAVLMLLLKYPNVSSVDVSEHAAEYLNAVDAVIEQSEKKGDMSKFGGQAYIDEFRRNKQVCEKLLAEDAIVDD